MGKGDMRILVSRGRGFAALLLLIAARCCSITEAAETKPAAAPPVSEGVPVDGNPGESEVAKIAGALAGLSEQQVGFEVIRESELAMVEMFDDMVATYQHRTELLTGIRDTALKYRRVHGEATRVVFAVGEQASQMAKWLPKFKALVKDGKAAAAAAVLRKLANEMRPLADRFKDYSKAHEEVRSEVEAHASKATELEKTAEWKRALVDGLHRDADGLIISTNVTRWPCGKLYPGGVPDTAQTYDDGTCKVEVDTPHLSLSDVQLCSMMATGAGAPVAYMFGGPAGLLALASATSFLSFWGSAAYGEHMARLQADFARIRRDLTHVHDRLTEQINKFYAIRDRLEHTAESNAFMADLASDPELVELLDDAIEEAVQRFGKLQDVCTQYVNEAVVPGSSVIQLLDA